MGVIKEDKGITMKEEMTKEDMELMKVIAFMKSDPIERMSTMGFHYAHGIGVKQNYEKAFEWYQKAADAGDAYAMYEVAHCYENGEGVDSDEDLYIEWLEKARDAGLECAEEELDEIGYY
jgi:TPR repeat protein